MPTFDAGQTGVAPGVTITRPDTTEYTARTTVGLTEVPAGSGSFDFAHPAPGTLLKFTFDVTLGGVTYYSTVWDDGLTMQATQESLDFVYKWITNKLVKQVISPTQHDLILYDDDGTTILKVWRVDTLIGARNAANDS